MLKPNWKTTFCFLVIQKEFINEILIQFPLQQCGALHQQFSKLALLLQLGQQSQYRQEPDSSLCGSIITGSTQSLILDRKTTLARARALSRPSIFTTSWKFFFSEVSTHKVREHSSITSAGQGGLGCLTSLADVADTGRGGGGSKIKKLME